MKNDYASIDKALNIENDIVETDKRSSEIEVISEKPNEIQKDYEYTRANLYSLIEKGQETLNGIMELAGESASPRAYEVAGQIIKSVADTTDKLLDLQKKVKEVDEESVKKPNTVTNNALFVGSTSELSKMLKDGFLDKK
jgi:NAD dependent epimerase/dehydratase family enzyme|tara:strand:+ start:145 stop:564 length:420 start_codon:yes stop_codon:yes gene_type:complete